MVPDTRLRLAAVQKALEDIIQPVIPAEASFAREQLSLIVRSIALVAKQIPHEEAVHVHDAHAFAAFGRDLIAAAPAIGAPLETAIAEVETIAPAHAIDRAALESKVRALRGAIERAVEAAGADPALLAAIGPVVIQHSERQNLLERKWIEDTGFDPDPDSLPTLETLLYPTETTE